MPRKNILLVTCDWCEAVISQEKPEVTPAVNGKDLCPPCRVARDTAIEKARQQRIGETNG